MFSTRIGQADESFEFLAGTAHIAEPEMLKRKPAFLRRCDGLIGETTLRIMEQTVRAVHPGHKGGRA
jgi:hypothetical protein